MAVNRYCFHSLWCVALALSACSNTENLQKSAQASAVQAQTHHPTATPTLDGVRFTPLTAAQRFTALQAGKIDVRSRITTITFQRDVQLGIEFPATDWYHQALPQPDP